MNWIDFSILFVLIVAFLNGYRRGTFKEISTLLGLVLSVIFAVLNADWLVAKLQGKINLSPTVLFMICYILVLGACIVLLKILGHFFYQMVKISAPKTSNKIFGGVFGAVKGLVVVSLVLLMFLFPTPFRSIDSAVESALTARTIRGFVPVIFNYSAIIHPRSGEFMAEIQNDILLANADSYASNAPGDAQGATSAAMTPDDIRTLDRLNLYFGKAKKQQE